MDSHAADPLPVQASTPPTLLDSEPGAFSILVWHNITIVSWNANATGSTVRRVAEATVPIAEECRQGFSNIHLVRHGSSLPTAEARAGFVEMADRYSQALACVAVGLLGSGFWASALQSAVTGMRMLSPRSFAFRIHNSIDAVTAWLPPEHLKRTGVSVDPDELHSIMTGAFSQTLREADERAAAERESASPDRMSARQR